MTNWRSLFGLGGGRATPSTAEPSALSEPWRLRKEAALATARALTAPSDEAARAHRQDARRLLDAAKEVAEREAAGREYERKVRELPGGCHFPDIDGPI